MEWRVFPVLVIFNGPISWAGTKDDLSRTNAEDIARDFLRFFTEAGVSFPEGSEVKYSVKFGRFLVKSTPEVLDQLIDVLHLWPIYHVIVEVKIIDITDTSTATALKKHTLSARELRDSRSHKVRIVDAMQTVSVHGVQTTSSKAVTYFSAETGVATNQVFESFLTATACVGSGNWNGNLKVFLTVVCDVFLPKRSGGFAKTDSRSSPQKVSFTTAVALDDGEAVAFNLAKPPEGGFNDLWALVSAWLIGSDGQPIARLRTKAAHKSK